MNKSILTVFSLLAVAATSLAMDAPSWAVGRFSGINPKYDKRVTIDISRGGDVEITVQGQAMQRGTWDGRGFSVTGVRFFVESARRGITVIQASDPGNKATYGRIGESNGGSGGGWIPPGQDNGDIPSWLQGNHTGGRNDYYDATIDLNVEGNGNARATVRFDSGRRQTQTGYYRDGVLTLDGIRFRTGSSGRGFFIEQIGQSRNRTNWNSGWGGSGGGDWNNGNAPSWAVGEFSGHNRFYDADIELDVDRNGRAVATIRYADGRRQTQTGYVNGTRLTLDKAGFTIRQNGNGFTCEQMGNSSNWMEYRRSGSGGGWGGGNWQYPPSWLIGTFSGRNAFYQAEVEINVSSNGRAEVYVNYPDGRRQTQTGGYQGDRLKIDNVWFTVERSGNGIRMTQVNDRDNSSVYRRR